MKKIIKLLVATGLAIATTNMVFAQSYTATAGTIKDDVDYALDERYYMDANINKLFINSNLGNKDIMSHTNLNLQTAFQFDKLYLGVLGNTDIIYEVSTKTDTKISKFQLGETSFKTLFGFNNMGISATCNLFFTGIPDKKTTHLDLGLIWGGTFNLNNFILKPIVNLDFNPVFKKTKDEYPKNEQFIFRMGLGSDFVFGSKSDLYSIFGVNYNLNVDTTKETEKNLGSLSTTTTTNTTNMVLLSYLMNYNVKDIAILGGKIDVTNKFESPKTVYSDGSVGQPTTFKYSLVPTLGLGAKFIAIPSVFNINAGFTMNLPNVTVTTTKATNTKTTKTVATTDLKPTITTGFEWTPYKNLVIDTAFSFNVGNTFEKIFSSINIGISYRK